MDWNKLATIRYLLLVPDGVLTDQRVSRQGMRTYHLQDLRALHLAREVGLDVWMYPSRPFPIHEMHFLDIDLQKVVVPLPGKPLGDLDPKETAGIGWDIDDIGMLDAVEIAACPLDAHLDVLTLPGIHRIEKPGGSGAVRSFIDMYAEAKDALNDS